jgi:hypothetical protein
MARAATGDAAAARADLAEVERTAATSGMAERVVGFNTAERVLRIAAGVLAGEIAAREGDHDQAIAHLRGAMEVGDGLTCGEPPDWPVPSTRRAGCSEIAGGAERERVAPPGERRREDVDIRDRTRRLGRGLGMDTRRA